MTLIAGLDIETSGLEQADGHRIIEIAILTYDFNTRRLVDSYVQRIDPERSIAAAAQEVHGISYEDLVGCPKWEAVAPIVASKLAVCTMFFAHNMKFDGPFVGAELLRVKQPLPTTEPFCTMENARWATPNGKYPRLGELCFALGVDYDTDKAHGASYDVQVMTECFWRGFDRGFYKPEVDLNLAAAA